MKRTITVILAGLSIISGVMTSGAVLVSIFFNHDNWSYWTVFLLSLLLALLLLGGMLWFKRKILPIIYAISGIIIFELTICFIIVLISLIGYDSAPLRFFELRGVLAIMWILVAWGICILISAPFLFEIRYSGWLKAFSFVASIIAILLAINLFIVAFVSAFYVWDIRTGPAPSIGVPFMIASVVVFITAIIYLVQVTKEWREDIALSEMAQRKFGIQVFWGLMEI